METVRLTILLLAAAAYAQAQSSKPPAAGLEPAWDMAVVLEEISAHAGRILPALNHLNPPAWVAMGGSDTYVDQQESSRRRCSPSSTKPKPYRAIPKNS